MMDREREDQEYLEPLVRDLPRSIEPPRDLWPAIARRVTPPPRRGWATRLADQRWAAALLLVALSSFVTWALTRRAAVPVEVAATFHPADIERYAEAGNALAAELNRTTADQLAPETRAVLARNLAIIDSAIAECRRALANDPANAALQSILGDAERQRLDFLQQVARLPRS